MNEKPNLATLMTIDFKKYRLRVYKEALHLIGDPKYIQLLVSTESKLIAIRAVEKSQVDGVAYKVDPKRLKSDLPFEIYSTPLIEGLYRKFGCFNYGSCYRLSGQVIKSERTVVFTLDSIKMNDEMYTKLT
jgi:hypothetical protein